MGAYEQKLYIRRDDVHHVNTISTVERIAKLETIIRGWVNYFAMAGAKKLMAKLDEMTRVRLRMIIWKQWKSVKRKIKGLSALGISRQKSYEWSNSRKSYCRMAPQSDSIEKLK